MIKILIIDDHPLVCDGIKTMLKDESSVEVVNASKTATEALSYLSNHDPDIILLDISLPDMSGLELCDRIRSMNKKVKIIGLTSTNEASIITGLLQRGGNGYLLKNMERDELIEAIHTVQKDKVFLSRAANDKILEQFQSRVAAEENFLLTRREKEILQLLADGLTGPQIAEKLFLSPLTIETHRKNLFKKFKVHSVQLLLKVARDSSLI
ncbi:MAG: response regulator transcription factor [Bacteroidetes bacterium]|nr:response regulator transcription factor [Bacteroidota bacterium]